MLSTQDKEQRLGRLEELRINAYLSEVARGYRNNAFVAQNLFPTIYSEKEKIDIFEFNKEAFNIYDTERAIRANSNVISPQGYTKEGNKVKYIRATDIYTPFLVGAEAGYLISGVNDPSYDSAKDKGDVNE